MIELGKTGLRKTRGSLGFHHGKDRGRALVCRLVDGDMVEMRPHGTRRSKLVSLFDVYDFAIRCEAQMVAREKREAKKAAGKGAR